MTSATAVTFACSLVALGLNARALGMEEFGRLALVQAYISFVSGLMTFDNWQPVVRLGLRSPKKLGLVIGSGMILDVCASTAAATVAAVGVLLFSGPLGFETALILPTLVYCSSLLAGLAGTPKGYFRLAGRFDMIAQNQIANGLLQVGSAVVLWHLGAPIQAYLVVLGIISAAPGVSFLVRMIVELRRERVAIVNPLATLSRRRYFKTFLRLASGNSILSSLVTSRHQVALFIVSAVAGSAATGLFAVASRCANAFARFVIPINQVIFPEIMRHARERRASEVRGAMRAMTLIAAFAALVLASLGMPASEVIVTVAGGAEFAGAAKIFSVLFLTEIVLLASVHFNPIILNAIGQRPLLILNLTIGTMTTLAALGLAREWGAIGVASAMLGGTICTYLALYLMVERCLGIAVRREMLVEAADG